jgi:hypothetical protein
VPEAHIKFVALVVPVMLKIEIFDREVDITKPVLRVAKADLWRDFDKLRKILEPMQVWFFQKRRVVA